MGILDQEVKDLNLNEEVKIDFDIFRLHKEEDEKGSMSYILVRGVNLSKLVIFMIQKIINKEKIYKKILLEKIADKTKISYSTIERKTIRLSKSNQWLSLAFLKELLNEYIGIFPDDKNMKDRLIVSCENIKISNGKSRPLKVVKNLSLDLCRLAGAHAADGCLYKKEIRHNIFSYKINLVEKTKKPVEEYKRWIYDLFGLKIKSKYSRGAWGLEFSNKIIFRYLNMFFEFPEGKKSYIVRMPNIIKRAPLEYKKAFVQGFMTFDGCVSSHGSISLGIESRSLRDSISNVLKEDRLEFKKSYLKKTKTWRITTSSRLSKDQLIMWLDYFIEGSTKYQRIYELINGFKIKPKTLQHALDIFKIAFPKESSTKIVIADILEVLTKQKKAFIWELSKYLKDKLNLDSLSYTPIKMGLYVLEKQAGIVTTEDRMVKLSRNAVKSKLYILNPFSEWRIPSISNHTCP